MTPEICPKRRSSGAASVEATVAGSAPGMRAETVIIGKSTRGMARQAENDRPASRPGTVPSPAGMCPPAGE